MGYLNYGACSLAEKLSSSTNCQSNNAVGVNTTYLGTLGTISAVTINASGLCTSISMVGGKKLYNLNSFPESSKFTENGKQSKFGNTTWTQNVDLTIADWSDQTRDFVDVLVRTRSQGIITLKNGNSYLIGVDNIASPSASVGMKASKADWTSGQNADDELAGVEVTLTCSNGYKAYRVDPAILTSTILDI